MKYVPVPELAKILLASGNSEMKRAKRKFIQPLQLNCNVRFVSQCLFDSPSHAQIQEKQASRWYVD